MSALLELAVKCEAAAGPDRELDGAIRKAVNGDFGFCGDNEGSWWCCNCTVPVVDLTQEPGCGAPMGIIDERTSYPSDWRDDERLPAYTASLDAAMTLVPEGWCFEVTNYDTYAKVFSDSANGPGFSGGGLTPALALCAAALRARSILEGAGHSGD